jgi:hypothetical protein
MGYFMPKMSHSQLKNYPMGHFKGLVIYNYLILKSNLSWHAQCFLGRQHRKQEIRMRWMETIKVQSATGKEHTAEHELTVLAREIQENPDPQGLWEAAVWSHATVPGCFALRLFWDTHDPQPRGSLLGMSLAQNLKAFGLVDHSVWIEKENKYETFDSQKIQYFSS